MSTTLGAGLNAHYVGGRTLATDTPLHALSDRELQVFRLIGHGRRTRQIAATLHLSIKTIESHCAHIKQKLDVESAAELAMKRRRPPHPAQARTSMANTRRMRSAHAQARRAPLGGRRRSGCGWGRGARCGRRYGYWRYRQCRRG